MCVFEKVRMSVVGLKLYGLIRIGGEMSGSVVCDVGYANANFFFFFCR